MVILITGKNGILGSELCKSLDRPIVALSKYDLDVTDTRKAVDSALRVFNPKMIIHCAAYTTPMKKHEEYPDHSIETNIIGTSKIASYCSRYSCKFVYISTDYVYPGHIDPENHQPYKETDNLNPINHYAISKLGGECAARLVPDHLIFRSAFTAKPFPHDAAFTDMTKSYIYADEAAALIWKAIDRNLTGIYNLGGVARPVIEFARETKPDIKKITTNKIKEVTAKNCAMDISKLKEDLK